MPLHLALTHLARLIDGDWCVAGDTIFVGTKERLAKVQQFELIRLRRWSRLGLVDNALTRALRADTRLEFIETPLSDVGRVPRRRNTKCRSGRPRATQVRRSRRT